MSTTSVTVLYVALIAGTVYVRILRKTRHYVCTRDTAQCAAAIMALALL